jgi:hypothetical protein
MTATRESICNLALGKIKAKPIASFDEDSLSAQECRRFYPEVIQAMLEGDEDWHFIVQRAALVEKANDREAEWTYAYQLPSNMARAIAVIPDLETLGLSLPVTVSNAPYMETWATLRADYSADYIIVGTTLYTNAENARLEYRINDITGVDLPHRVGQALAIELAAHLAVPLKGDSAREKDLLNQTETAWERAIADSRNRQPTSYPAYESEMLAARHS